MHPEQDKFSKIENEMEFKWNLFLKKII